MPERRSGRRLAAALAVVAALAIAPAVAAPGAVGEAAPTFVRPDLDGRPVDLAALRGRVVLLAFWATWCEPCRDEAPRFSAWQRRFRSAGLAVVGVSLDERAADARAFVRARRLAYPTVMLDADLGAAFGGITGLPQYLLIDRAGTVVERTRGEADLDALEGRLRVLLARRN